MIKYIIQGKKNPLKKTEIKYYPQMAPSTPMTLAQIVKRVEKRSTVSSADVKAVLDALQYEVIEALENGNSVRLGDLGSFRLTMKSQGVETVAEAKKKGAQLISPRAPRCATHSPHSFSISLFKKTSSMLQTAILLETLAVVRVAEANTHKQANLF